MKAKWKRLWLWTIALFLIIGLISIPFWGFHHQKNQQSSSGDSKQTQTTNPNNPSFSPKNPSSGKSQPLVWQYGINGKKNNIDTDLLKGKLYNNSW